jgi:hypothetical protein
LPVERDSGRSRDAAGGGGISTNSAPSDDGDIDRLQKSLEEYKRRFLADATGGLVSFGDHEIGATVDGLSSFSQASDDDADASCCFLTTCDDFLQIGLFFHLKPNRVARTDPLKCREL